MGETPSQPSGASTAFSSGAATYDAVPYRGQPFRQTHPAHLSAVARLLRIDAPLPQRARVLELGCCDGGNLIPMAEQMPEAKFVGIDYSPVQIEMGRRVVDRLGLKNIELRPDSILDLTAADGEFDYILCHGVFSWVPENVRDKILDVCATNLSPTGIAYISYNAFPGWHMRGIVREMMRYHALRFETPQRQTQEARLILEFVSKSVVGRGNEAYSTFLKDEAETLKRLPDHYLYHEHLEDHCHPYYFKDFIAMARARGLDYLGESQLAVMTPTNFGPDSEKTLRLIAENVVELEQHMDFLRSRTFRETLLIRAGRSPSYKLEDASLDGLLIQSKFRPATPSVDLTLGTRQPFVNEKDLTISSASPLVKAALFTLAVNFPEPIALDALVSQAREHLRRFEVELTEPEHQLRGLQQTLIQLLMTTSSVAVQTTPGCFTIRPGDRPIGSPYARLQAIEGPNVTTRRHTSTTLSETTHAVLLKADGTRTIEAIVNELGNGVDEPAVRKAIAQLARLALLIA